MSELLTAAQMRAVEAAAIKSGEVTGQDLMERAGQGVVDAIFAIWPEFAPAEGSTRGPAPAPPEYFQQDDTNVRQAVVLCGPGNNGGDGFVIARRLHEMGWEVSVYLAGDEAKLPIDAATACARWRELGAVETLGTEACAEGERPDLLIDAMLGIGVSRPLPLDWAQAHRAVRSRAGKRRFRIVAVDCPSGFDCDRGTFCLPLPPDEETAFGPFMNDEIAPRLVQCDLCVTFHRAKIGHYLTEVSIGRERPVVVDLGLEGPQLDAFQLSPMIDGQAGDRTRLIAPHLSDDPRGLRAWLRTYSFDHVSGGQHKYQRGHALVLGGGVGKGGAGRLAARAALRIGAGLVTLGVPKGAVPENAAHLNAVMLRQIGTAAELTETLRDERIASVCLGPGLGVGQATRDLVLAACNAATIDGGHDKRRMVLDADALTSFQDDPDQLFENLHDRVVLTPHEGEFARLFPDLAVSLQPADPTDPAPSRVDAVRAAAARAGCTVLLKGPATVIAGADGATSIHAALYDRRARWLGTAGAGDVLAGMLAGLLANPMASFAIHQNVEVAAFLHVEAARAFGPGLIAEDLPEQLPQVFRDLGL